MDATGEIVADSNGGSSQLNASSVAALALLAANASMLFIYFVFDLMLFQIVVIYWWEALWIGLFGGLKLLTASLFGSPYENRWIDVSWGSGLFLSIFAIIKSGGVFLVLLALTGVALVVAQEELTGMPGNDFVSEQAGLILKCSLLFLAGHGLSFIINFVLNGEFRRARIGTLLWLPFRRCLALFVTVAAALTTSQAYPSIFTATSFAALLIVVKISWDYMLHLRERHSLAKDSLLDDGARQLVIDR
jgi:hypothetical protein